MASLTINGDLSFTDVEATGTTWTTAHIQCGWNCFVSQCL